jgi:hypothetical protein
MDRTTLERALASVATQTYRPIEVVVVAASGSSHRALPVRCGPHALRLERSQHPLKRAEAWNALLDASNGDWLNFLDDDDELLPGHVETLVEALNGDPSARLAHAQSELVGADGAISVYGSRFEAWRQLDGGCFQCAGAMFSRSLLADGARADDRFEILEDMDFFVQLAQLTRFTFVPRVTSRWYHGAGSSGTGAGANFDAARVGAALQQLHAKWASLKNQLDALPSARLARARDKLGNGLDAEALGMLRPLVDQFPSDVNALNLCGLAELRAGSAQTARELFSRALAVAPGHRGLLENLQLAEAKARTGRS